MSGRRDELETLRRVLSGSQRLVTLTGPGGIGKTWMARLAADDLGRTFSDGTFSVELGDLAGPGLLAHTVAAGLGLQLNTRQVEASGIAPLVGDRHVLLVLDRCEHLLPECAHLVAELLRGCPGLHVLATSRQALRTPGERVVTVPPLAVPPDPSSIDRLTAMTHDGVAFFVERAAAVLPSFRLTEDNVEAVCALCARLEGNPLALELAAARAGLLSPQAILDRLDQPYRLLVEAPRDDPAKLRSLRACVDASWDLCTDAERTLWARLSVFPADFELDAAEEVCSGEGIEEDEVLDLVASLLEKSVLSREAAPTVIRYRLPETLRVYGAERLGGEGLRRWSDRHLRWSERLVLGAAQESRPRPTSHVSRMRREYPHVRAALDRATEEPAGAGRAFRMVEALASWWVVAGRLTEARHWLAAALRHGSGSPGERSGALTLAAWYATLQGDVEEAERLLDAALRIGDGTIVSTVSAVARARGGLALRRGDVDGAAEQFAECASSADQAGNASAAAEGRLLLGLAHVLAGREDEADQTLRSCVAVADRAGDPHLRASAVGVQALAALWRGQVAGALVLAREALRSKAEVGDRLGVVLLLEVLAGVALADGDAGRAAVLLGSVERTWRELGLTPPFRGPLALGREERITAARAALGRREFNQHAARGAAMTSPAVIRYALDDGMPRLGHHTTSTLLTSRELAVAELVARGMTNREIAGALVISVRTVQGHVESILRKLGFGSRVQVAAWVAQRGVETIP